MRPYARVRKLASEEREELERMERSRKPAAGRARRAEIVLLSDRGYTAEEIGERLGCHQETASRWIDRFNRLGLAGLEGGPPEAAMSAGDSCAGGPAGVAERWFERVRVDGEITLLYEPHAHEFVRSNVWHVRGKDRDLLVDAGLGAASLREAYPDLFERDPSLVLTHAHFDHAGGALPAASRREMAQMGMPIDGDLIDALPREGYDVRSYRVVPAPATRTLAEGDAVDLGDRRFAVLHLPGHSPGSIGLSMGGGGRVALLRRRRLRRPAPGRAARLRRRRLRANHAAAAGAAGERRARRARPELRRAAPARDRRAVPGLEGEVSSARGKGYVSLGPPHPPARPRAGAPSNTAVGRVHACDAQTVADVLAPFAARGPR